MTKFKWTTENCSKAREILCNYPHNLKQGMQEVATEFGITCYAVISAYYGKNSRLCKYCREHPVIKVISGDDKKLCVGGKNAIKNVQGQQPTHIMFFSVQSVRYTLERR